MSAPTTAASTAKAAPKRARERVFSGIQPSGVKKSRAAAPGEGSILAARRTGDQSAKTLPLGPLLRPN